ncbi:MULTISPECIES: sugar porter family MFS transporter [unclassified Frondihabitans]|uniref:sugar porter family MFS transporter n=1 Tax=unclassified Frondihabitans TaxID=2626248 RepID=UPI000F4F260D|nr:MULTISPECIES: sugar porter family MFS transporter [unclassified Frondihabitans]RPE74440.1 sugar porter (SP) family MFS transporter [Frondihabitans sp. PhB153]RPF02869.1 sugar porter (SP) family MFS transporter [Frondihabitans sp. PhB161]
MSDTTSTTPPGEAKKLERRVTALAVAAAVGGFLFGFDSSVINGAVDSIAQQFGIPAAATGITVASALLGCAVGAYVAGRLADRFGRIKVMLLGAILFFASSILAGLAFAVWDFVLWRVIAGIGIGIASVIAPAYISEVSPKGIRGRLGSFQQLAITLGIFAALLSDQLLATGAGSASAMLGPLEAWRWMFIVGVVPAAVYGILALRLPESPRYLAGEGRRDEARSVLSQIVPTETVETSLHDIEDAINTEAKLAKKSSVRGPVAGLQGIVWVGIILAVLQQFVGINVIFYYSTTLWKAVGFQESDAFLISTITSVVNVAVTFVAIALVDKVGRRPMLLAGSIGMTLSLAAMAVAFSQADIVSGDPQLPGAWGPIALVAANLFVVSFGATWGPLMWVLLGEMFPPSIRAAALGIGSTANWIANFVVTVAFPVLSAINLTLAYSIFAFFALLSLIFVFFKIKETKGRSLEEMGTAAVGANA